jgi:hypothetical protein
MNIEPIVSKGKIKQAEKSAAVLCDDNSPSEIAISKLNNVGATIEKSCKVLNDMLTANSVVVDKYGEEHITADHRIRHLGALTVLEIHKVIKDKSISMSMGVFQDPTIIADSERILNIKNGKKNNS